MEWRFLRSTNGLTSDPDWAGLTLDQVDAPPRSEFIELGSVRGALWTDHSAHVRVGWLTDAGSPIGGSSFAATIEPVLLDRLPHPANPQQFYEVMSIGDPVVDDAAWANRPLPCPRGLFTVRVTAFGAAPPGATRMGVWVLMTPGA